MKVPSCQPHGQRERKQDVETFRQCLLQVMEQHDEQVRRVAEVVGVSRMQVYRWLKEIGWTRER